MLIHPYQIPFGCWLLVDIAANTYLVEDASLLPSVKIHELWLGASWQILGPHDRSAHGTEKYPAN
jgi:hypothetical protein